MDPRAKLIEDLHTYSRELFARESPFYTQVLELMADDVAADGPCWELLEPYALEPSTEYYPLRALAGVHRMVLDGSAPALRDRYPSTGGDGDATAAWPAILEALASHDPDVLGELRHPLQTNETSRCGPLAGGFHVIAKRFGLPMRILELGASAGLNLHFDRYRYEAGGLGSGPPDSPVHFVDYWKGGAPPFDVPLEIVERRGCDLHPIDASTEDGRISLLSYVMPDELERIEMMRAALSVAALDPVTVDRESADTWIARMLETMPSRTATVVFHSIFWIYPPAEVTDRIAATIEATGARASADAPLCWLRYEENPEQMAVVELRLRTWPGEADELLARGRLHFEPVEWLG